MVANPRNQKCSPVLENGSLKVVRDFFRAKMSSNFETRQALKKLSFIRWPKKI